MRTALVLAALAIGTSTHAEPRIRLRMGTVAPNGSAWAHELTSMARELEVLTNGQVGVKWYMGGVAGGELEMYDRVRKGQLDGMASGGMVCERLSPTMRIQGLLGVFQSRDEAAYVMNQMRVKINAEAQRSGAAMLIIAGIGPDVIFVNRPVHTMAELRQLRLWRWEPDEVAIAMSNEMGLKIVPTEVADGAQAFDEKRIDGFLAIPTAGLAYQWAVRAGYFIDLRSGYLTGCFFLDSRVFDALPVGAQSALRTLAVKYGARFDDLGRRMDEALLGGLFEKQGVKVIHPSEAFRAEYFEAARAARERKGDKLVPPGLIDHVLRMLADYRAEHSSATRR
jgi:TRAP-type C4-dicarboxylate transport system substrate-binding protein